MRKLLLALMALTIVITLSSCTKEKMVEITAESQISMENLDEFLFRDDVQYVDLRNHEAVFKYGYIDGFESIPFFDYLDYRAFDRNRTYEFSPDQLEDTSILLRLFDKEKAILLYADGCIRSGYIKDALNHLGYERVFVIGGYYEYIGDHKIQGDGSYEIGNIFFQEYIDDTQEVVYIMYGEYDVAKNITNLRFNILDFDYNCVRHCDTSYHDDMLTIIEEFINDGIFNFNEIIDQLNDTESEISSIEGVDWTILPQIISLLEMEYRD